MSIERRVRRAGTRKASLTSTLVSLVLFKLSWIALVIGQQQGLMPAALLILGMTGIHPDIRATLWPVLLVAGLGITVDMLLKVTAVLDFGETGLPVWLAVLWLAFAITLSHGMAFLGRLQLHWQVLVGLFTGPLVYALGARFGAAQLAEPLWSSIVLLALVWACLLPISLYLLNKGRTWQQSGFALVIVASLLLPHAKATAEMAQVGRGTLRYLLLPVYDAYLYADNGSFNYPPEGAYRFGLVYHKAFNSNQIINETVQQWQQQDLEVPDAWIMELQHMIPDVGKGDSLELQVDISNSGVLLHNGLEVATVDDTEFLQAFIGIWLEENTSEPALRNKLLGEE